MSSVNDYSVGQRWLSNTESELGLGAIINVDFRTIEVLFPATGDTRTYTKEHSPLTRLVFVEGDTITSQDGWKMIVASNEEHNGVLTYHGFREDTKEPARLPEPLLDHHIKLNQPEKRLFNLQLDAPKWFDLRLAAREHLYDYAKSSTIGLSGARIELIPHQLHIASEVAQRHAPRVLLADEVGLGKTIEAALIIHQQIKTGRAERVLILVPNSLLHQWLVEMLRRVNLAFSIFDEERCDALSEQGGNPFDTDQLVLASIDFLRDNPKRLAQALESEWDLLVVDEAHHLAWTQDAPSTEYSLVESLAAKTPGVLLLTATPDQLGHESHFARLKLLDSARFHDYQTFLAEENKYAQLAQAVAPLIDNQALSDDNLQRLIDFAPDILAQYPSLDDQESRLALLHQLIDCHGTGRILFRNRRAGIAGFPERKLLTYPLPLPDVYQDGIIGGDIMDSLFPERQPQLVDTWVEHDPRVEWLMDFLASIKPAKVLLICSSAVTAQQLAETIRTTSGIRHSVFHEGMSIVERDRAAHYFSDPEDGAQVLLCSEIGSEGRNFQFAHHLVLFDLPVTPDLLEQRIGRLDRIGQKNDVHIHVPVIEQTGQYALMRWYKEGLNAFERTCPTGRGVYDEVKQELLSVLENVDDHEGLDALIEKSAARNDALLAQLEQGRDKLLELNASGDGKVDGLINELNEQDDSFTLPGFFSRLLDGIGVNQEEKNENETILTPGESMINNIPGLDPEGMTITYDRSVATTLEHVHYITWDHPLVHNAIDVVLTDTLGKASLGFIADPELPKGAFWLEAVYTLDAKAEKSLQLGRFLPTTPIRVCLDAQGNKSDLEFYVTKKPSKKIRKQLVQALQQPVALQLTKAEQLAHAQANQILHDAKSHMQDTLNSEAQRLSDLQKQNPAVRDSEIVFLQQQMATLTSVLEQADVQLDSVRVVVNNP